MTDTRLWDVEIYLHNKECWMLISESITYAEFIRMHGVGDYADFRLTSSKAPR